MVPPATDGAPSTAREFVQHTRQLHQQTRQVAQNLQTLYQAASDKFNVRRAYQDNPYTALAVAFGVGYTLGGGLFSPFTMRTLKIGTRAFALPLLIGAVQQARNAPPQRR